MKQKSDEEGTCTGAWSIAYSGSRKWTPLLPDMNATYWYYAFTIPKDLPDGVKLGIRFKGEFGHARYQGFNFYDDDTGDLVWGSKSQDQKSSMRDIEIEPDPGSQNPYRTDVNRNTPTRNYTLHLVPEGTDVANYTNAITYPLVSVGSDPSVPQERRLSVYLRIYLPDKRGQTLEELPYHLSGGVPLPSIEAINTADNDAHLDCPATRLYPGFGTFPEGPKENKYGQVHFYRVTAEDYYPNQDTAYLISVFKEVRDTVAVIRVKPPTHTDTSKPRSIMLPPTEVRYWSFDVNSTLLTNVTACLADHQATVAEDGFVYLALGREVPEILKKVKAFGLNFLPWGAHEEILLVYRQILANFASSARAVPVFDPTHYRETQSAYCSFKMNTDPALDLDVDYAPVGAYYSETDFLDNFSGFELPDIVCAPILVD